MEVTIYYNGQAVACLLYTSLGGADEHAESAGRGNNFSRVDLPVVF